MVAVLLEAVVVVFLRLHLVAVFLHLHLVAVLHLAAGVGLCAGGAGGG